MINIYHAEIMKRYDEIMKKFAYKRLRTEKTIVSNRYSEERNLIPRNELLEHVSLSIIRNVLAGIPELKEWGENNAN